MENRAVRHIRHSLLALLSTIALLLYISSRPGLSAPSSSAVSGALSGHTIAIDPGHGGYDGGARAPGGRWEKHYNLDVALRLRDTLQSLGATVIMTRDADYALCDPNPPMRKKRQDMERRADLIFAGGAELVLSIHMNEYRDRRQSGPQVFYRADCPAGRELATLLQEEMVASLSPKKARAAAVGDFYILSLGIPSVLVECGFLSNAAEEALLRTDTYAQRVAEAIAGGVVKWFEQPRPEAAERENR